MFATLQWIWQDIAANLPEKDCSLLPFEPVFTSADELLQALNLVAARTVILQH
jgi:hypothetical protein